MVNKNPEEGGPISGKKKSHEIGTSIHQGYITRRQVDTIPDSYICNLQYIPAPSPATFPHHRPRRLIILKKRRRIFGKNKHEKPPSPSPFAEPGCVAFWPQRRNVDGPTLRYSVSRNYYFTSVGFVPVPVGGHW